MDTAGASHDAPLLHDTRPGHNAALVLLNRLATLVVPSNDEYYDGSGAAADVPFTSHHHHQNENGAASNTSETLYELALSERTTAARSLELRDALKDAERGTSVQQMERTERSRLVLYTAVAVGMLVLLFLAVWLLSLERSSGGAGDGT